MIDSTAAGQQYAAAIRDQGGKDLKFPILYPTLIMPGSQITDDTRYFGIDGGNGKLYHGYKFVITMPGTTYPTAYYGVSGTDWLDAAAVREPQRRRARSADREYDFYYDGGAAADARVRARQDQVLGHQHARQAPRPSRR